MGGRLARVSLLVPAGEAEVLNIFALEFLFFFLFASASIGRRADWLAIGPIVIYPYNPSFIARQPAAYIRLHPVIIAHWLGRILSPSFLSSRHRNPPFPNPFGSGHSPASRQFPIPVSTMTLLAVFQLLSTAFVVYISSLVFYRLFLHPLSSHPGPFLAKITDWYSVYHAYLGDRHLALYRAHEKYGPVVRFAPNLISFNSASSLKAIYGHSPLSRSLQKSEFYKAFPAVKGVHNTHNAISKVEHGRKRRVLSAAFSEAAMKSVEDLVLNNINIFLQNIRESLAGAGKAVDMGDMFSWLTFDVMGELCFGKSFGMLTEEGTRFVTDLISQAAHNHYIVCSPPSPLLSCLTGPTDPRPVNASIEWKLPPSRDAQAQSHSLPDNLPRPLAFHQALSRLCRRADEAWPRVQEGLFLLPARRQGS